MPNTPRYRWLVTLTLLAIILFSAYLWLKPLLSIGGGYAAKQACSCHFLQGRTLDDIRTNDLNFSVLGWYSLALEDSTVHSSFFGLVRRKAKYIGRHGCVLITDNHKGLPPSTTEASVGEEALSVSQERLSEQASNTQVTSEAYKAALDYGMQPTPGGGARGIVILKNGKLVAERYAPGFDKNTLMLGWSMTKTLTGLLVGKVVHDALRQQPDFPTDGPSFASVTEQQTHLFPHAWQDERANISLADLLHMNSGLTWNEGYGAITDATVMLHEQADFADFALRSQLTETPGTVWTYSSGTTNILMEYVRTQLGTNQTLFATFDSLFAPAAAPIVIEPDQSGRPVGSSYGWATARGWANIGQLMLQDGVWEGDTLVPPGWIDFMRQPAAGSNGIYGAHLWLPGPDTPSLPADAFVMRGFQDQRVYIIPSKDMVIARLGHGEDQATDFEGLVSRILAVDE